jgi:hypothetical protein
MKRLFILSLLLFTFSITLAQSFSLPDLIKMAKMDEDSFDTFVSSKGFVYSDSDKNESVVSITYALFPNPNVVDKAKKFITFYSKYIDKTGVDFKYFVTYQTSDNSEFIKIKNQSKIQGFKFRGSNSLGDNTILFTYDKWKTGLYVFLNRGPNGKTIYEINYGVVN